MGRDKTRELHRSEGKFYICLRMFHVLPVRRNSAALTLDGMRIGFHVEAQSEQQMSRRASGQTLLRPLRQTIGGWDWII